MILTPCSLTEVGFGGAGVPYRSAKSFVTDDVFKIGTDVGTTLGADGAYWVGCECPYWGGWFDAPPKVVLEETFEAEFANWLGGFG